MAARPERHRRSRPPVEFETVRRWTGAISQQASAISTLLGSYYHGPITNLHDAGLPEAEKLDAVRALMDKVLARHVTLLVEHVSQLNRILEDKPPLSQDNVAWLHRQLGLDGGGA